MTHEMKQKLNMLLTLEALVQQERYRLLFAVTDDFNLAQPYLEVLNNGIEFLDDEANKLLEQFSKEKND